MRSEISSPPSGDITPGTSGAQLRFGERERESGTLQANSTLSAKITELLASKSRYASPGFEPLTRALEILSSANAARELAQLRADWQEVDALVDHVVALHHVEFTTSLQDYRRVVELLKEVQMCMMTVRRCLGSVDGVRVDEAGLGRVTREHAEAVEVGKLLRLVRDVVVDLEEVEGMGANEGVLTNAQWERKVKLLLQVGNTLARDEVRDVPAVSGLIVRAKAAAAGIVNGLVGEARQQAFGLSESGGGGFLERHDGREERDGQEGHVVVPLASSTSNISTVSTTISCIAQLDAVEEVLMTVREGARDVLRGQLVRVVQVLDMEDGERGNESPVSVVQGALKRSEGFFLSACVYIRRLVAARMLAPSSGLMLLRGGSITAGGRRHGRREMLSAYRECQALWDGVQRELLHVLAAALGLSVQAKGDSEDGNGNGNGNGNEKDTGGDKDAFLDLIRRTNSVDHHRQGLAFSVDDQVGGWGDGGAEDETGGVRRSTTTTKTTTKTTTTTKTSAAAATDGMPLPTTGELMRVVRGAIGEELCSVQSSPALYLPVFTFVSGCCKYMEDLEEDERKQARIRMGYGGDAPPSPSSPSMSSVSSLFGQALDRITTNFSRVALRASGSTDGKTTGKEFLLSYVVDILRTDFVPSVYVLCGYRTQELVAGMAVSNHTVAGTYSVAHQTIALINEMLDWSSMAPVVAYDVIGVLENSLGKIAESLRSQVHATVGQRSDRPDQSDRSDHASHASQPYALRMARDPKISHLMAQEPIATLVGGPEWFACRDAAAVDSFLTSAMASGFALGKHVVSDELFKVFMDLIPVESESLLLQSNNAGAIKTVVSIAVIGQTAERIANGMYEAISAFSEKTRNTVSGPGGARPATTEAGNSSKNAPRFIGLVDVANRYRAVSGLCTRILRIEAMLTTVYAMQRLVLISGTGDEHEHADLERDVALLAPKLASMDDVLANHLPQSLRQYVFGSLQVFLERVAAAVKDEERAGRALAVIMPVVSRFAA